MLHSEPCIWIKTPLGEYAVYAPHKRFSTQWDVSVKHIGEDSPFIRFKRVSTEGPRPKWWRTDTDDIWPPPSPTAGSGLLKRHAPTTTEHLEALSLEDKGKKPRRFVQPDEGPSWKVEKWKKGGQNTRQIRATSKRYLKAWSVERTPEPETSRVST